MNVSRRGFVAAASAAALARGFAGGAQKPNLTVGLLSDVHIRGNRGQIPEFVKALEFFRDSGVDAVVITGDIADKGFVRELVWTGEAWAKVFPGNKAPDGRTVEKIFVLGNHDYEGYTYGMKKWLEEKFPDEEERKRFLIAGDPARAWEQAFGEPWTGGVFAKKVKGYTFVGAHWGHEKELGAFLAKNAKELGLGGGRPFFYAQHQPPKDTVFGSWCWGNDGGRATRVLEKYPDAVALSGHAHHSLTDERNVWQGAFTSVGCSSLDYIFSPHWRENSQSHAWEPPKQMKKFNAPLGKQGMVMRVYEDFFTLERREFIGGEKLGADWTVPLKGKKLESFAERKAKAVAPEFAEGAKPWVEVADGKDRAGNKVRQAVVKFPAAKPSATSRVYDYEVQAQAIRDDVDFPVAHKRVLSESFHLPPTKEAAEGKCVFALSELPEKTAIRFMVRPIECFGKKGRPVFSDEWRVPRGQ